MGIFKKSAPEDNDFDDKCGMVPSSERKCRDIFCCLLFAIFWGGMAIIALLSLQNGNPKKLLYGIDYNGNICGIDDYKSYPKIYYPKMNENILSAQLDGISLSNVKFSGICVQNCPQIERNSTSKVCEMGSSTKCYDIVMNTTEIFFRCLPFKQENRKSISSVCLDPFDADVSCTIAKYTGGQCDKICKVAQETAEVTEIYETEPNPVVDQLEAIFLLVSRLMGDIENSSTLILGAAGVGSIFFGMIWLLLLQYFAGCMIWITNLLVILTMITLSLFCSIKAEIIDIESFSSLKQFSPMEVSPDFEKASDTEKAQFKAVAYVLWAATLILLLVLISMMKRIRIAIAIFRESSKCIKKMPLLLFWPILPAISLVVLFVYWIIISGYILSMDEFVLLNTNTTSSNDTVSAIRKYPSHTSTELVFAYHLFGLLWTNQFLQAISICTISGAVSQYYWTLPDQFGKRDIKPFPILNSFKQTIRFHLGSLCFGSLVIAMVQMARVVLEYIDHNSKDLQESNTIVKIMMKMVKCCLWCFEKLLKFISKNAYIIISMKGSSFCSAARQSFFLILSNVARMATVNTLSYFLLLLSKITITAGITSIVFYITTSDTKYLNGGSSELSSPMAPILCTALLAWFITSLFMNVYDLTIDTILVCFCEDAKMNSQGSSDYMSKELSKIMGESSKSDSSSKKTKIEVKSKNNISSVL